MHQATRLFDCLSINLKENFVEDMLAAKEGGQWKKYSTRLVKETVDKLSAGLLSIGVSGGDRSAEGRDKVALLSKNRPEWIMLDLAVQQVGAILTPLYPTINVNELEFVLNDAQAKVVFVNDEDLYLKVISLKDHLPYLQKIYTFEHVANAAHWKELLAASTPALLEQIKPISDRITGSDLATIIYTSGTTGTPKGVMLSHHNIITNLKASMPCFPPGDHMRALSFLPLNHILERMVTYLYLFKGTAIYYAESMETIGDNLKEVKPHLFTTVPRLLEKVYDKIMLKGKELTGTKRKLFFWAHKLAERFEINSSQAPLYQLQLAIANKLIFSKWREALGGNVKAIISGGAACQVRLIRIFTAARIVIMEGYGLTETSPVISVNRFQESGREFGSVGPCIEGVEVKIAEDGEILCKGPNIMMGYYKRPDLTAEVMQGDWLGPNIMMGYYKRPDLTAEVMQGDWFMTGDIGTITAKGFLKITDRKKELFKTSGGKYVAPLPIESRLKESLFIEQTMVIGAERKFVSALIVPSFPNLLDWCRQQGITETDPAQLCNHKKVIEHYQELVESFNKFFNPVEQVKKFALLPRDWSVDTGELTPKLSLKRKVILEKFRDAIEQLYG